MKQVLQQQGYWKNLPLFVCEEVPSRDMFIPQDFGGIFIGAARPYCWMTPDAFASMKGSPEIGPVPWPDPPEREPEPKR